MPKQMSDAIQKTIEQTNPTFEKFDKTRKKVFEHFAALISIGTIALFIILYAYEKSFYSVYNIPVSCINLDLKTFLEVATQICSVYVLIVYYYSSYKTEEIKGHIRINPMRWFWATLVLFHILQFNSLSDNWFITLPICFLLPGIIELSLFIKNKPLKNRQLSEKEYDYRIEDLTSRRIGFLFATKTGIIFIVLFTLLASLWGNIKGVNKMDFQVLRKNEVEYVIVVDYQDSALVQKCKVQDKEIVIFTDQYWVMNKEDNPITYKKYSETEIK